ncbi:MAG: DUF5606 domain-containing protein [Bacteroidales bacterium]|nr:DUF5606 domain-containing protein [Bacteroidales bacterium]
MDLKEILSISGKSGLSKVVARTKNGVIVESLIDKKRYPVFVTDKMSSLDDIRVFCMNDEDIPLVEVFKKISDKQNAKTIETLIQVKDADLKLLFETYLPEYDKERVYTSDIKKVFSWYNLLIQNDLLKFDKESEEKTEEAVKDDEEVKETEGNEKTEE